MWDRLSCVDRNGEITGYRIQYGTTTPLDQTEMITGTSASNRTFTASGLVPLTTYMFRIAAVNSDGVGPYSNEDNFDNRCTKLLLANGVTDQCILQELS